MRITESRLRRIIREEAYRALHEQSAPAPSSGAALSAVTGMDQATAERTAATAAKLLEPNPILKSIFPGGYKEMFEAIKSALLSVGKLLVPSKFMFVLQDMLETGAVNSILSRESKAGKKPIEIVLAVVQAAAARSGTMSERRMRKLRESRFDGFGGGEDMGDPFGDEDEEMTVQDVIERYKDEGARSWMRVSNDFHEMADGGMDDIREKYYPGLSADDCAMIARTLDLHFGMAF